jgi:uncharacterized membrane protein
VLKRHNSKECKCVPEYGVLLTIFKCVLPDFAYLTTHDFHLLDTETNCCKANHNDLTSRSTVFLENLITVPVFYKSRMFITMYTRARHRSLSWVTEIQTASFQLLFLRTFLNSIVSILPLKRRLSKLPRPFRFSDQNFARTLISPIRATCPAVSIFVR